MMLEIIYFFNKILIDGLASNLMQTIRHRANPSPVLLGGGACWMVS